MTIYKKGNITLDSTKHRVDHADLLKQGFVVADQKINNQPIKTENKSAPLVTADELVAPIDNSIIEKSKKQQADITGIGETLKTPGIMDKVATPGFINAAFQAKYGRDAKKGEIGLKTEQNPYGLQGATVKDVVGRLGLEKYAPNYGIDTTTDNTTNNTSNNSSQGGIQTKSDNKSAMQKSADLIREYAQGLLTVKEQARQTAGLEGAGDFLTKAQQEAETLRTDIEKQKILNIKELDKIGDRPIPMTFIRGAQSTATRGQKLDMMLKALDYNNALVNVQIAQGAYDRAKELSAEIADDAYKQLSLELDALTIDGQIETNKANEIKNQLEYDRNMAMNGYIYISNPDQLYDIQKRYGITPDNENQYIYRDPTGKMYLKPSVTTPDELLSPSEAKTLGVPYGTTKQEAFGITPKYVNKGSSISNTTDNFPKGFWSAIKQGVTSLQKGEKWGTVWDRIKTQFKDVPNEDIDKALGAEWKKPGAFEEYKQKQYKQTEPKQWELEGEIWKQLSEHPELDNETKRQWIMSQKFNPDDFGIY